LHLEIGNFGSSVEAAAAACLARQSRTWADLITLRQGWPQRAAG